MVIGGSGVRGWVDCREACYKRDTLSGPGVRKASYRGEPPEGDGLQGVCPPFSPQYKLALRIFNDFDSITVDGDGQVFVLDGQAQHIRVFDSEGAYVETVARRGEGPAVS